MAKIKLFCERFADAEAKTRSQVTFCVTDINERDTYLVLNLNTENRADNFKNELIADALYMWQKDDYEPTWNEIDDLVTKVKRSGVLFL